MRGFALLFAAVLAAALGCSVSGGGMHAIGTVRALRRHDVPSLFEGGKAEVVTRIAVDLDHLTDPSGREIDPARYVGLEFEGGPELLMRFKPGDRVSILTTTPTGMHIRSIEKVSVH